MKKSITGARIKLQREKREWSQIHLCEKLGLNNSVLSRIEAGKRPVEDDLLVRFADIFDVSTDYLTGRTNDPRKVLSHSTKSFLDVIELEDEDAIVKLRGILSHNGHELPDETIKEILSYARYKVTHPES